MTIIVYGLFICVYMYYVLKIIEIAYSVRLVVQHNVPNKATNALRSLTCHLQSKLHSMKELNFEQQIYNL